MRHTADWGLRSPPLYSCKILERSLKSAAELTIFLVLIQILEAVPPSNSSPEQILEAVPPSNSSPEHIFSGTNRVHKSPQKSANSAKSPCSQAGTRTRLRKSGSVSGLGIKIRAKVARILVPSLYPAKDGRIRTPDFSFSLIFLLV
jgi:hypothetical protein